MSIYLEKNKTAEIVAYYGMNLKEFDMPIHTHNRCEIMYTVSGICNISVDGDRFTLKPNQFVFIDQNVPHQMLVEKGEPCVLLNLEFLCEEKGGGFSLEYLKKRSVRFQEFLSSPQRYRLFYDDAKVCYAIKDLIEELEKLHCSETFLLETLFYRLMLEIVQCSDDRKRKNSGMVYLNLAKQYITEHFDEDLRVRRISQAAGVNHSYLQTLFAKYLGCGIMSYVNNMRLEKACFLLKNSDKPITDIAFEVGYNSRQQFGYSFEKRFGQSPMQFRKLLGQNLYTDTRTQKMV